MDHVLMATQPETTPESGARMLMAKASKSMTLAVVGDVHGAWDEEDEAALAGLGVDLVVFVGDFGNEDVELINRISQMPLPKAVILGNHDAWYTASDWGRKKCPYNRALEDRVQQQLELLGERHVGYGKLDVPGFNVTIVGGRPFSWGGTTWRNAGFYLKRYGIKDFETSTARILNAVKDAATETILFVGHCGPAGLGDRPEDPCGKDWNPIGGDYGDPDLQQAIAQAKHLGKQVPLVMFGHMHHTLRHTQSISRVPLKQDADQTIYLNAAVVPRIKLTPTGNLRNFSLVTLVQQQVTTVSQVWVNASGTIFDQTMLFTANPVSLTP